MDSSTPPGGRQAAPTWPDWEAAKAAAIAKAAERQAQRVHLVAGLAGLPAAARERDPRWGTQPAKFWNEQADSEAWSNTAALVVNSDLVRLAVTRELALLDRTAERGRALEIALAVAALDPEAGYRMARCNHPDYAELGICVHPDEHGAPAHVMIVTRRQRCWLRVCPKCAADIAARLRVRYERRIRIVTAKPRPGWSLKKFVLTLDREIDDEGKELKRLGDLTKKWVKHFWGARGAGALATFEIGATGGKLHAHGIAWGCYVPQAELSAYWQELSGCPVVWVKRCTVSEAVREGIKYIGKLSSRDDAGAFVLSAERLALLHMALKGKRRLRAWGCFYGLADFEGEPAAEADELPDAGERCADGHKMIFVPVWLVRSLLHLKGAIKCSILEHPPEVVLPGVAGAGPPRWPRRLESMV